MHPLCRLDAVGEPNRVAAFALARLIEQSALVELPKVVERTAKANMPDSVSLKSRE